MADIGFGNPVGPTLRITAERRDFLTFTLWAMVTFVQFPGDDLLLYPLALYYAYTIWRDQALIAPLLARAWVIMLFPIWCLLSISWAVAPVEALKFALYLGLTMVICFQVAASLTPRQIMHAICLAASIIGVINFIAVFGMGKGELGIFSSKKSSTWSEGISPWPSRLMNSRVAMTCLPTSTSTSVHAQPANALSA